MIYTGLKKEVHFVFVFFGKETGAVAADVANGVWQYFVVDIYLVVDAGGFDGFAGVGIGQVVWLAIGAYKGGGPLEGLQGAAEGAWQVVAALVAEQVNVFGVVVAFELW